LKPDISIYIIGAGGIVNTAHLPAYKLAGFNVQGIYDLDYNKAAATAAQFQIPAVYKSLPGMMSNISTNAVFDIAVPANQLINILEQLPNGAAVLMQKPMGENFAAAKKILTLTRDKKMIAAVNFQLRYAPFILAAKKMISEGAIGELCDVEINVNAFTPWHLWDFLFSSPRVEILYHSIHYIDLVRNLLGNPVGMYAKTTKHPYMKQLASVRSNIIMDYGDMVRANILTNHCHRFGLQQQQSYIKLEGTTGAIKIQMGVLVNYPEGIPDTFEYVTLKENEQPQWESMQIEGSWFPHAFAGSMQQVMMAMTGAIEKPGNSVEDCIHTMACVEAAYQSSEKGGIAFKDVL
jgi:predicted dehydrogenase